MAKTVYTGGHRGMGCTDHDFYQTRRDIAGLAVENTVESILAAFAAGADYVETDAVMSGDGVLFTLHNVVPRDHFFTAEKPDGLLNDMPFADIARFKTGRGGNGIVRPFGDVLAQIGRVDPRTADFVVNIEIKGVQGSGQPYEVNNFIEKIAYAVSSSPISASRVLFSSFSLANIIAMSHRLPDARYGMLYAEKQESRPIYTDMQDAPEYRYLPFDAAHVALVSELWGQQAAAGVKLSYAHPEINTINAANIAAVAAAGAGINCWALFEEWSDARAAVYLKTAADCKSAGVPFTVITDYIPQVLSVLK